jgi:hypothetical protein
MYSLAGNAKMVQAESYKADLIDPGVGGIIIFSISFVQFELTCLLVVLLEEKEEVKSVIANLTHFNNRNRFAESFASQVGGSIEKVEKIGNFLESITVPDFGGGFPRSMYQVARLIKIRSQTGSERDVFYTVRGGYDSHTSLNVPWSDMQDGVGKLAGIFIFIINF